MSFEEEHREIVNIVKNLEAPKGERRRKGAWNKFLGDATNRIVMKYLSKHLPDNYISVGPGAYIEGVPKEFDLVVVDRQAKPIEFTNAYPRDSVLVVVEVKRTGVFYKKREAEEKMRKHLIEIVENLKGTPFLYITFHESEKLIGATRQVYGSRAFFLSTGYKYGEILRDEWKRFVETVVNTIESRVGASATV